MPAFRISNADDDRIHLFDYTGSPATGLPVYEGIADRGTGQSDARWIIKKYTYDGSNQCTSILFASTVTATLAPLRINGATWSARATYTYA